MAQAEIAESVQIPMNQACFVPPESAKGQMLLRDRKNASGWHTAHASGTALPFHVVPGAVTVHGFTDSSEGAGALVK
jgi:hypothetical protein